MASRSCMVRFTDSKRIDATIEIGASDTPKRCLKSLKGAIRGDPADFVLTVRGKGDRQIVTNPEQIISKCLTYATDGTAPYSGSSWNAVGEELEVTVEVVDQSGAKKAKVATDPKQKKAKRTRVTGPEKDAILHAVRETCPVTPIVPGEQFKLLLMTEAEKLSGGMDFYGNCMKAGYIMFLDTIGVTDIAYPRFVIKYNRHLSDNNSKFKKYHKDKTAMRVALVKKSVTADDLKKQLTQWASANKTVSSKWKAMKRLYKYELVEDEGTTIKLPSARRVACEKLEQTPEHKALVERFNEMFPPDSITLSGKHISKGPLSELLMKTPSPTHGATPAGLSGSNAAASGGSGGAAAAASGAHAASASGAAAGSPDHEAAAATLAKLKLKKLRETLLAQAAEAKASKAAEKREKDKARRLAKAEAAKVEAVAKAAKPQRASGAKAAKAAKANDTTATEAPSRKRSRSAARSGKKVVEDEVDNSDADSDDVPLAKQAKGKGKQAAVVELSDSEDLDTSGEGVSGDESDESE